MNQGKWSCISQVDSGSFANIPVVADKSFHFERDMNPSAEKGKDAWRFSNWIPGEKKLENFYFEHNLENQLDVDTVDEDWCLKEVITGAVIDRKGSPNYGGWSIVVRTVIRWEEQRLIRITRKKYFSKSIPANNKPEDVKRWEANHGEFRIIRSSRRNSRRSR